MKMRKTDLGILTMKRIMKKAGAIRVSDAAAKELAIKLEEEAQKITKRAIDCCSHSRRITIQPEDIELAAKLH